MLETLQGKRIAISGLAVHDTARLTEELDQRLAFCRTLPETSVGPDSTMLENFDLLVLSLEAARPWFAVPGRISDPPFLVFASQDELAAEFGKLVGKRRGYVLSSAHAGELSLRAAVLLAETADRKTGPRQPPLVVTADDDLSITTLIRALLTSDGIRCENADNGATALELARKLRPDVLVLDVHMPTLGGFEVLTELKRDPMTARMRVILLTGAEQESDIMRGFALGASDYIVKPFNPMELLVRIRRFIRS